MNDTEPSKLALDRELAAIQDEHERIVQMMVAAILIEPELERYFHPEKMTTFFAFDSWLHRVAVLIRTESRRRILEKIRRLVAMKVCALANGEETAPVARALNAVIADITRHMPTPVTNKKQR